MRELGQQRALQCVLEGADLTRGGCLAVGGGAVLCEPGAMTVGDVGHARVSGCRAWDVRARFQISARRMRAEAMSITTTKPMMMIITAQVSA